MNPAYLFNIGENYRAYDYLGVHRGVLDGQEGHFFRVWAPNALSVHLCGSFNDWDVEQHPLTKLGDTGIWEGFRADTSLWDRYRYYVTDAKSKSTFKSDPFGRHHETRPSNASIIYEAEEFIWEDEDFLKSLPHARAPQPLNIYEVHLGSWRLHADGSYLNYRDLGQKLADYCSKMGYNAVELMPITEYPYDKSWGYQVTGYFAPTSRFGTPEDLKHMINTLHKARIRVILDWVPAHFPKDEFGLFEFDGTSCYEYTDARLREQKAWGTMVFDYGKAEVCSFLYSSAYFWLNEFHFDGIRVDAVSSMIYLNYGHEMGLKNRFGGEDNLEALYFLRTLNELLAEHFPHALLIAEESTAYPYISKQVEEGGLGFTHKWNMGWMHDTLDYFTQDYFSRKHHHHKMTFSLTYAFSENFILPYSHDEVVHGKRSLIGRMPGDNWRQFASLRTCLAWQIAHPGAKLNFMGNEIAQFIEWRDYEEIEWFLLEYEHHRKYQAYSSVLNHLYLNSPALHNSYPGWDGFEWIQVDDQENSVFAFFRKAEAETLLVVLNMTPTSFPEYTIEIPFCAELSLLLNSDDMKWGGSDYYQQQSGQTTLVTLPFNQEDLAQAQKELQAEYDATWEEAKRKHDEYLESLARLADLSHSTSPVTNEDKAKLLEKKTAEFNPKLTLSLPPLSALFFSVHELKD